MTPARKLYEQLQTLLAGERAEDCMQALCDSLASAIGFVVEDMAEADRMIDSLPADLKRTVRENWAYLREIRATSGPAGVA